MHRRDWSLENMIEEYYALKRKDKNGHTLFSDVYLNKMITECYAGGGGEIVQVCVREGPDGDYYGWIAKGNEHYSHVYRNEHHFSMCFGYGYEAEEKRGNGRMVRLSIEEISS